MSMRNYIKKLLNYQPKSKKKARKYGYLEQIWIICGETSIENLVLFEGMRTHMKKKRRI